MGKWNVERARKSFEFAFCSWFLFAAVMNGEYSITGEDGKINSEVPSSKHILELAAAPNRCFIHFIIILWHFTSVMARESSSDDFYCQCDNKLEVGLMRIVFVRRKTLPYRRAKIKFRLITQSVGINWIYALKKRKIKACGWRIIRNRFFQSALLKHSGTCMRCLRRCYNYCFAFISPSMRFGSKAKPTPWINKWLEGVEASSQNVHRGKQHKCIREAFMAMNIPLGQS